MNMIILYHMNNSNSKNSKFVFSHDLLGRIIPS